MDHLKRLSLTLILMFVLSATAFAETPPPPCAPGQTESPPCAAPSKNDDSADPGETLTPPAPDTTVDVTDITEAVMWALSLF